MMDYLILILLLVVIVILFWLGLRYATTNTREQCQVKLIHEDDIVEGHLWCEHCKYNDNCEEVLENCVNVIFNGKVCHPKSAEL